MDDAPFVCRRAALTRVYRHTTGAQPIEPEHMQNDSDDEIYPEWTQQLSRRMMEDFQDVNEGEKEMMIMWNHHVMKHKYDHLKLIKNIKYLCVLVLLRIVKCHLLVNFLLKGMRKIYERRI
jgi:hypothetical protein